MSGTSFLHFIDNRFVASKSERQFDKRSPVDGSLIGSISEAGQEEVDAAVQAALPQASADVRAGRTAPSVAARQLLALLDSAPPPAS